MHEFDGVVEEEGGHVEGRGHGGLGVGGGQGEAGEGGGAEYAVEE